MRSRRFFKLIIDFSEGKVGKSSILLRFVHDQFNKNHLSTVQASFMNKKIHFDNKRVNLNIWDTAGQEIFHALGEFSLGNS
jgi:small GTP-binding protein